MMNSAVPPVVFVDKENTQPSPLLPKNQAAKVIAKQRAAFGEITNNIASNKSVLGGKSNAVVKPILKKTSAVIQQAPKVVEKTVTIQAPVEVQNAPEKAQEVTSIEQPQGDFVVVEKPKLTEAELLQKRQEARALKLARQDKIFQQLEAAWNGHKNAEPILNHTVQDGVYHFSFGPSNHMLTPILKAPSGATKKKIDQTAWHLTQVFMLFKQYGFNANDPTTFMKSPLAKPQNLTEKIVYNFCASHVLSFPKDTKKMATLNLHDKAVKYLGQRKMPFEFLVSLLSRNEMLEAVFEYLKKETTDGSIHAQMALAEGCWTKHGEVQFDQAANSVERAVVFKEFVSSFLVLRHNFNEYRSSEPVQEWLATKPWCGHGIVAKFDMPALNLLSDKANFSALLEHHKNTSSTLHLELQMKMKAITDEAEADNADKEEDDDATAEGP